MRCTVVIPAGGLSKGFGTDKPKQFIDLAGKPMIAHSLIKFQNNKKVDSIIVPVHSEWYSFTKELIEAYNITKVAEIVIAGKKRQESIYNALLTETVKNSDIILIHDATRPLVTDDLINKIIESADEYGAAIPAVDIREVIKEKSQNKAVVKTLDPSKLCIIQTPQGYWQELIVTAYKKANEVGFEGQDSSQLLEFIGYKVQVIDGNPHNIPINNPIDIIIAEQLIKIKS